MGSMITLGIGNFELDWGKNFAFNDHSDLFQPSDVAQVPYHYVDDDGSPIVELKEGYSRALGQMLERLELLGWTLDGVKADYFSSCELQGIDPEELPFETFAAALKALDVQAVSATYDGDYDFGEFFRKEIDDRLGLDAFLPEGKQFDSFSLGYVLENLSARAVLRLLAENPANLDVPVIWRFADVVENGWVDRDSVVKAPDVGERVLIVTEGSSDARILKHALGLLRPEVADFFRFIDMQEGYPFTGTGELHRFCQGLVKIEIANHVLVIYDNDAEGCAKFEQTLALPRPETMRVMKLPDFERLRSVQTVGPEGPGNADINGRAAAIECYLDTSWKANRAATVRWSSYNRALDRYQGALEGKDRYTRRFMDLRTKDAAYDFSGVEVILNAIIAECKVMARRRIYPTAAE